MSTNLTPTALAALHAKGCLKPSTGTADRDAVASLMAAEFSANHVHAADAIDAGGLAVDIFEVADASLTSLVRALWSTGHTGKVQAALANGYVLCPCRVSIVIPMPGGETMTTKVAGRFVSDDADEIKEHLLDPAGNRALGGATAASELGKIIKSRRPEMATKVDEWTEQLALDFAGELGTGADEGDA